MPGESQSRTFSAAAIDYAEGMIVSRRKGVTRESCSNLLR